MWIRTYPIRVGVRVSTGGYIHNVKKDPAIGVRVLLSGVRLGADSLLLGENREEHKILYTQPLLDIRPARECVAAR